MCQNWQNKMIANSYDIGKGKAAADPAGEVGGKVAGAKTGAAGKVDPTNAGKTDPAVVNQGVKVLILGHRLWLTESHHRRP